MKHGIERFMFSPERTGFPFSPAAAVILYSAAGIVFSLNYAVPEAVPRYFDGDMYRNNTIFFVSFYVPYFLCALAWCGCFLLKSWTLRGLCLLAGLTAAVVQSYMLEDFWTVTIGVYCAYILVCSAAFSLKKSAVLCGVSIVLFFILMNNPHILGEPLEGTSFAAEPPASRLMALLFMLLCAAFAFCSRIASEELSAAHAAITHLNETGTKMSVFNQKLQEYAKEVQENAVKNDRQRFTSDLHDSSGYVFTNIIAMSEAAMSLPVIEERRMRETLHIISREARMGLQKTREILRTIRSLPDAGSDVIDSIYAMKTIFEEVTHISVEFDSGNIQHDYGAAINGCIIRIVQEAFTNSIRHGFASYIHVQLWERDTGRLTMTVSDNGKGSQNVVKGIGLAGMEERIARLGGSIEFRCPVDGGFRINVELPL